MVSLQEALSAGQLLAGNKL